ncbi:PEP/pyruvate-binding domain-containing protein [Propioniciclava sinopodophylli]|uniref:PEP/pyruvate-binding domain-containing protein n=1 Tax=Propioniciclava sinopodophylli TaxID=1837344 RepID=UPI0013F15350|nr:PEP/pyruvate-binding domain-containing protein [Propioniciclava sinopodophylli]
MSPSADLARQGGKGANLVRLRDAGLPVPAFVVITTDEYAAFVADHGLAAPIAAALRRPAAEASDTIRAAFAAATPTAAQRARIVEALAPLLDGGEPAGPLAVRSSATAEDLPGFSFAGQQDSCLSVTGMDAVVDSIVACWSSLWTERAITYRTRNGIGHDATLAVVVQQMVDADASGVLFTANPHTGRRDESVVEAVTGLGDALVSGRVTPDTFVLETATGTLRSQQLAGAQASVSPSDLQSVLSLGRRIVELYAEPMDVEWARADGAVHVLQARPITSLYPLPAPNPARHDEPEVWFSFGAFQGLLEPMTPLGQEAIRMALSGGARLVGRRVDWRTNRFIQSAGERLWIRLDSLIRIRATRKLLAEFLPLVEPGTAAILATLAEEPGLRPARTSPSAGIAAKFATLVPRLLPRIRAASANPERARRTLHRTTELLVAHVAREMDRAAKGRTPQERLTARVRVLDDFARRAFPTLLPVFAPIMAPTLLELRTLRELAAMTRLPDADALAMAAMRALPGNVTTEMDLVLSDVAATIKRDATAWGWVAETPASDLARQFTTGRLPRVAQSAIADFLASYGMRGVAEIDLGARRWRDDPTPVMHTLKAYLALPAGASPRAVHKAGQHEAGRSIRKLMDASTPARAQRIKRSAQAIRGLAGARETPKFTLVRCLGLIREGLDASAAELVENGRLGAVPDIAFLRVDELERAFAAEWHEVVAGRRAVYEAEGRRRQIPRVLVGDGRAFYDGLGAGSASLGGAGVSPGVAEGPVRVVLDPRTTPLKPGEILVCPGTDPAWTPLFLVAGGLVTEVGGLMTHGSVVAREYGIPAVVGVHAATTRLVDGQRVRIDGSSGAIELL